MKRHRRHLTRRQLLGALAALAALLAPTVPRAHSYKLGDIAVGHIWASAPESGEGVAVYGPILNRGDGAAQLTGASTPAAEQVRIRMATEGEEHWVDWIDLEPGKPLALAPWRQHLWLTDLKRELKEGDAFELLLDFGQAGTLTVQVEIEPEGGH
ncbi:copper chaperone PCu(A)C [Jiella pacifica]|uniref:Copper chaperone PCu(A)C n=1 Tax=Jiella pacifica TaxID=2696469 RepID=A0A6N9TGJ9_9HYPH|nr:copper chaperone PCu(A)C [Jiella pacifica]NDW07978.1 copper chaperone PCu(A)C [Jiella pacifica]